MDALPIQLGRAGRPEGGGDGFRTSHGSPPNERVRSQKCTRSRSPKGITQRSLWKTAPPLVRPTRQPYHMTAGGPTWPIVVGLPKLKLELRCTTTATCFTLAQPRSKKRATKLLLPRRSPREEPRRTGSKRSGKSARTRADAAVRGRGRPWPRPGGMTRGAVLKTSLILNCN